MSMDAVDRYPIRPVGPDSFDAIIANDQLAFAEVFPAAMLEAERALMSWERSIGAYDGDELVGYAKAYDFALSVPGAVLPSCAGVSGVAVRTTHRRRGILTSLMRRQLTDLHESGRYPVATLWASEPVIYGRYGYGLASRKYSLKIPRDPAFVDPPSDADLQLRIAEPAKVLDTLEAVSMAGTAGRPGVPVRTGDWWRRSTMDPPDSRGGGKLYCLLAEGGSEVRGYALYVPKGKWEDGGAAGTLTVREVIAADPAAYASLWRYLVDVDLMATTEHWNLPVDDPLLHWLSDAQRTTPRLSDGLFARLVDVGAALMARTYRTDVDVVLDVTDAFCPWNTGRWRLSGGASGAVCTRTADPADLALDVRSLGSAYLGGVPLRDLARAQRVAELRPGSLAAADIAFGSELAPWCPFIF